LQEAEANVRKTEADRLAAEARVRVAKANLARTKTMLGYTEMKAPYNGVITRRSIDTGHYISSPGGNGGSPLMVVARTDKVRVFVDVPEMEAALVDVGDPAVVRIQAAGLSEIKAAVTRTTWSLLESNRSLRVEVDLSNSQGRLRPGMYATVAIGLERRENAIMLPVSAIIREGDSASCCAVVENRIDRRTVELGLVSGKEIEISSGIDADDLVVLKEAGKLKHGQAVEVSSPPQSSTP
jgi:RND family efflux transporter MFP subunit